MLVPGLAADFSGLAAEAFAAAPALSRCLSRSRVRPFTATAPETAALALFEVPFDRHNPPVAPFSYLGDAGRPPRHYVLRADPVHLRTDTRGLILFDAATFPFSAEESRALADTVAPFLAGEGWRLETFQAQRWYLCADHSQDLSALPLSALRGKALGDCLPAGSDAAAWLNRGNEIQMLMYSHPVNRQRAAQGRALVNSLWVWGGAELPGSPVKHFTRVLSADSLIRGLAIHGGSVCEPQPQHAASLLEQAGGDAEILLVLDECSAAAAYQDVQGWNAALEQLERNWFEPLLTALEEARIGALELFPVNGYRYCTAAGRDWRFWRRRRGYREVLGT